MGFNSIRRHSGALQRELAKRAVLRLPRGVLYGLWACDHVAWALVLWCVDYSHWVLCGDAISVWAATGYWKRGNSASAGGRAAMDGHSVETWEELLSYWQGVNPADG